MIAFHADPDGNDDFYLIGADGNGLRPLTEMAETVAFPYWSPDGAKIAYLCCSGFDASLWVMNADGSGTRRLTVGRAGSPSWSPDGRRIAYDDHDDGAVWVVGADGSGARPLADDSGGPRWSPDGRTIAFFSSRHHPDQEQRNELYVMDGDGSNQVRLTDNEAEDVEPTWSPDGTWIAFTSSRDGNPEIYVTSVDGSDQRRLTTDPAPDEGPAWSPDGSRILFTSYRDGADPLTLGQGNAEIFTVEADGSALTNLTNDPAWKRLPCVVAGRQPDRLQHQQRRRVRPARDESRWDREAPPGRRRRRQRHRQRLLSSLAAVTTPSDPNCVRRGWMVERKATPSTGANGLQTSVSEERRGQRRDRPSRRGGPYSLKRSSFQGSASLL